MPSLAALHVHAALPDVYCTNLLLSTHLLRTS